MSRFTAIELLSGDSFMGLDLNARRNLELTETLRSKEKKGSLLWVLDSTKTSMGRRLLKNWIEQPLKSPARIIERLDAVEALYKKSVVLTDLSALLDRVFDLERLMTKVMYKSANPRDLKSLSATAMQLPAVKQELEKLSDSKLLAKYNREISTLDELVNLVENAIMDEPPISVKDGGVIKEGFNKELDDLRHIMNNGKGIIDEIEQREKEATGIKNLKIGYNRVFGYYLEVTRSYYDLIPEGWIRKQTLANAERFITEELKNAENAILGAKDKALSLEADIFSEVRDFLATKLEAVQKTASSVAAVDVLCSFANVALRNQYTKPDITIDGSIDIKAGRHPVVELMLTDEVFVPNDLYIDNKADRMSIITGPNMSGKSTYMRQAALIVLMAQIGSFVPADSAKISVVDKIFTRVGASDDLTAGQSTFMVEMSEVSDILKNATHDSLVILDEVGRGTSTFDGVSIARAVAEYICSSKKLRGNKRNKRLAGQQPEKSLCQELRLSAECLGRRKDTGAAEKNGLLLYRERTGSRPYNTQYLCSARKCRGPRFRHSRQHEEAQGAETVTDDRHCRLHDGSEPCGGEDKEILPSGGFRCGNFRPQRFAEAYPRYFKGSSFFGRYNGI